MTRATHKATSLRHPIFRLRARRCQRLTCVFICFLSLISTGLAQQMDAASVTWFKASLAKAKKGDAEGEYNAGICYLSGTGVAKDLDQGRTWLQKSADQNLPVALSGLGFVYQTGLGVPKDLAKAFILYLEAARAGDVYGQKMLAECYTAGNGTIVDPWLAFHWFKEAAVQGDLYSQTQVGEAYQDGTGTEKDAKQAFNYFLHAAYQGFGRAQFNVGRCYDLGLFVPRDPVVAYKWCKLAESSYKEKEEADILAKITKELTPTQLAKGDKLVEEWPEEQTGNLHDRGLNFSFGSKRRTKIPFIYEQGHILIEVELQGHKGLHFMVDTGAPETMLDAEVAAQLGIVGTSYAPTLGFGREFLLSTMADDISLQLPGLALNHLSLNVTSFENFSKVLNTKMDGILGFDLLKPFAISIDYVNKTIEFIDPTDFQEPPSETVLPLITGATKVEVEANIVNHGIISPLTLLEIDTGMNSAIVLGPDFIGQNASMNLTQGLRGDFIGIGGSGIQLDTTCSEVRLGSTILSNPTVSVATKTQGIWIVNRTGFIGNEIWRRFDVTLDFLNKKIFLKKNANFNAPYDKSQTGLSIRPSEDKKTLFVLDILPDSPASRAGFQIGDVIYKIDGLDLSTMKATESRDRFRTNGLHLVTIKRDGQEVVLKFVMDDSLRTPPRESEAK